MNTHRSEAAGARRSSPPPFLVKDCALVPISTGRKAYNLRELRDHLMEVEAASIYNHFWGGRLRAVFDELEYNNDFAAWVKRGLDDLTLAERLAVIDPADYASLEDLRQALIDVVEQRLDEQEYLPWAKRDDPFVFIRSQMVVFDTDIRVEHPRDMADALVRFSPGSIFYHAIDARQRREDGLDDFRVWVDEFGPVFRPLREALDTIDPYFLTLSDLRNRLMEEFARHGGEVGR